MRHVFILLLLLMYTALPAQQLISMAGSPATGVKEGLHWESREHNFGEIKQGVPVTALFTFTNTSDQPLLIKEVKAPCGCTVASYTRELIAPGAQGQVISTYNAASPGVFYKTIRVLVNTQADEVVLRLKGTVVAQATN
jgi:hypothetical protein